MPTSTRLADKVALITGGASGIGREIARRYVAEGARVVIADRNAELVTATSKELGTACAGVEMDVTRERDTERAAAAAVTAFGRLDIGVNCAGLGVSVPLYPAGAGGEFRPGREGRCRERTFRQAEPLSCIRRGREANSGPVGKGGGAENGRSVKQSLYPVYALATRWARSS